MEKERSYCVDFHNYYSFFYYLFELEPILVGLKSRYDILFESFQQDVPAKRKGMSILLTNSPNQMTTTNEISVSEALHKIDSGESINLA
jgi:hypothetical protein